MAGVQYLTMDITAAVSRYIVMDLYYYTYLVCNVYTKLPPCT
jgi:hypothetical protein